MAGDVEAQGETASQPEPGARFTKVGRGVAALGVRMLISTHSPQPLASVAPPVMTARNVSIHSPSVPWG